jgi:hypothetical protein
MACHLGRLPLKLTETKEVQLEEWENIVHGLDGQGSQGWKAGDKLLGSDPHTKCQPFHDHILLLPHVLFPAGYLSSAFNGAQFSHNFSN